MLKPALPGCSTFWRSANGNVAITFAIAGSVIVAAAGAAIDFARWASTKSELQAQLDAAVLAGTQKLAETGGNEALALEAADAYFAQAIKNQTTLTQNTVGFELNSARTGVKSKGNASIQTSLLKVVGVGTLPLLEQAEAAAGPGTAAGNLEVALILDVTGSMCADGTGPCTSGSKFTALKDSANDLIDAVIWPDQSTYTSRISLIPFNAGIRVGPDGGGSAMMAKLTNLPATWSGWYNSCVTGHATTTAEGEPDWVCTSWAPAFEPGQPIIPCITGRYIEANAEPYDLTDDPPGPGKWILANDGSRSYASLDSSDTPKVTGLGGSSADLSDAWNYGDNGACSRTPANDEFVPLTSNKSVLKAKITSLEAMGATAGQLGVSFGWYTLSPRWASVWPSGSAPGSYADLTATTESGTPKLRKVAIFMTDGVFNAYRGWVDESMKATFADNAEAMCTAMKDKGIEIYTIGYDLDSLPALDRDRATQVLRNCGTDVAHFYNSINATELATAFEDISTSINAASGQLRLIR